MRGFERVLFEQSNCQLILGKREERVKVLMTAVFAVLGREKIIGEAFSEVVAVKNLDNDCSGRTILGNSGVQLAYSAN